MWRLGENLIVKYSLAAKLVSGLSGPARMTCMTMDADQLRRFSTDSSLVGVSHLVFLNVSGSTWEVSLNHPSVNWLSKLDVEFCQRHQCRRPSVLHVSVPEERGSTAHDVWWTFFRSSGTILRQNCGLTQRSETVDTAQVNGCSIDLCVSLSSSCLVRHS